MGKKKQFDLQDIRNRIVELRYIKAGEIKDHPAQWRKHTDPQRRALQGVLRDIGIADALLVWRSEREGGALCAFDGHLRKGLDPSREWPVLITDLTDEEADYALATHDPLGAMARADQEALAVLLESVRSEDAAVQEMLAELAKESGLYTKTRREQDPGAQVDRLKELRAKWGTERGQLWEIPSLTVEGQSHRLLCGDSTSADDVQRLMAGRRAALFATDPPYLVGYDGTNHPHKWNEPGAGMNKDWSETYHDWDRADQGEGLYDGFVAMAVAHAIIEDAAWYCWHASRNQAMVEAVWKRHGAFVHQQIIWVKDRPILTHSWYMWQHEPCLFGWVEGHQPCFFGWVEGHKPKRIAGDFETTVWHSPTTTPGQTTDHPTSKPVLLFATPMRQHTVPGDLCYEPFSGSGTQLVAGEQLGRLVYAMELQPEYVAVALERLAGMGLEPKLGE